MRSQLWLARATSLQPPLSAAWVEEWTSGLVQTQHRPWDRRASSACALLAANAEAPDARDRWRDGFALRATAADALRSVSARLDGVATVDASAEELAVSVPLAGGVGLRLVGAADRRARARGGAGGILRVDDSDNSVNHNSDNNNSVNDDSADDNSDNDGGDIDKDDKNEKYVYVGRVLEGFWRASGTWHGAGRAP